MQLTIESRTPGREPAVLRVPVTFIISQRAVRRAVKQLLHPLPEHFVAPEEPDYVFNTVSLEDGSVKLVPEQRRIAAR